MEQFLKNQGRLSLGKTREGASFFMRGGNTFANRGEEGYVFAVWKNVSQKRTKSIDKSDFPVKILGIVKKKKEFFLESNRCGG